MLKGQLEGQLTDPVTPPQEALFHPLVSFLFPKLIPNPRATCTALGLESLFSVGFFLLPWRGASGADSGEGLDQPLRLLGVQAAWNPEACNTSSSNILASCT